MKKIYKAPLTEVVKFNSEVMLVDTSNFSVSSKSITNDNKSNFNLADKEDYDDFDSDLW